MKKWLFSIVAVACFLGLAEWVLSVWDARYPESGRRKFSKRQSMRLLRETTYPYIEEDPVTINRLKAGYRGEGQGVFVRINALGLRGSEYSGEKAPGTKRIMCLGDSITFGWGVEESASYPMQLQRICDESGRGVIQVLNAGIPTQTSHQGWLRLSRTGLLELQPDIVIISYGFNDQLRVGVRDRDRNTQIRIGISEDVSWWRETHLYRHLFRLVKPAVKFVAAHREARVPEDFFYLNLCLMVDLVRLQGMVPVLMDQVYRGFKPCPYNPVTARVGREKNVTVIHVMDALKEAEKNLPASGSLFLDGCHPTSFVYPYYARTVWDSINAFL